MTTPDAMSRRFGWLVTDFVNRVAGVAHAIVVSSDGLLLTASTRLPRERAEQLAAIASGLASMTTGAAKCFEAGQVSQTVIEMERGTLLQMGIGDGSCLTVLASPHCDMGLVAYEMTMLVERVGQILTPELRSKLNSAGDSALSQGV